MIDRVIVNGRLWLGGGRWQTGAVAIGDGVIVEVGDSDELLARHREATVVDARGASILPGFHDTHAHPPFAGSALLGIDLTVAHDAAEYAAIIRAYAAAHPEQEVLAGAGWYGDAYDGGFPTRQVLDGIVADRPVVLNSHDGHGVWANSAALDAAGIDDSVQDPAGGRFARDAAGRVSGVALDTASARLVELVPEPGPGFLERAILAAQDHLHSVGITAWHDAAVGRSELGPDTFHAYLELARQGLLTATVVLCQWWDRERGLEQVDGFEERRDIAATTTRLRADTVKIMLDGMVENRTAAMLEPYALPPTERGDSFVAPDRLIDIVARLDTAGFQVHVHAVGDRAVREALDAFEHARSVNGATDGRHQITHLDLVDPADLPRFAILDVTANVQLLWARNDTEIIERKLPLLGDRRAENHFPFGSLHRSGARIAAGSDWPVSDPNPLWAIHTGTTRLAPSGDVHATGDAFTVPLLPDEALPFAVALDAFTTTAAWVGHLDQVTGRIAPGLAADLVILDRDVSAGDDVAAAVVLETLVGGVTVFRRVALGPSEG